MIQEVILTEEMFRKAQSSNGGWSKKQLELLNVAWPPKSGWKKKKLATPVKKEVAEKFISLKDEHLSIETK